MYIWSFILYTIIYEPWIFSIAFKGNVFVIISYILILPVYMPWWRYLLFPLVWIVFNGWILDYIGYLPEITTIWRKGSSKRSRLCRPSLVENFLFVFHLSNIANLNQFLAHTLSLEFHTSLFNTLHILILMPAETGQDSVLCPNQS